MKDVPLANIIIGFSCLGGYCLAHWWFKYQKEKILKQVEAHRIRRFQNEENNNFSWFQKFKTLSHLPLNISQSSGKITHCTFEKNLKENSPSSYIITVFTKSQKYTFLNRCLVGVGNYHVFNKHWFIDSTKAERMFVENVMKETRILLPELDRLVSSYVL